MDDIPFTVSQEAAAHIVAKLRMGREQLNMTEFLPALYFAFNSQSQDREGHVFERCAVCFFDIGWYRPENLANHNFDEIDLCGEKIYVHRDTMNRLAGKVLVLETVEVGFPNTADKKVGKLRTR
jgi:hypothetical protein